MRLRDVLKAEHVLVPLHAATVKEATPATTWRYALARSAALVVKIIGLIIEFGDKEDAGDDIGALILFALASIVVAWLYVRRTKAVKENS